MTACVVYRCSRQDQMYLYLREGFALADVPEALRQRTGRLSEVMRLLDDEAAYAAMARAHNPFGDGTASQRIARLIL